MNVNLTHDTTRRIVGSEAFINYAIGSMIFTITAVFILFVVWFIWVSWPRKH